MSFCRRFFVALWLVLFVQQLQGQDLYLYPYSVLYTKPTRFWHDYCPETQETSLTDYWKGKQLSGTWWGLRNELHNRGIDFSIVYTNNPAGNPVGGISQGFTYCNDLSFGMSLDLEKLVGWQGGLFTISAVNRAGKSLSDVYIGNVFLVQELFGSETLLFYALHLEQSILNDRVKLKLGRFAIGDDFAISPIYGLYMSDGVNTNPLALPDNTTFSTYPWAVWGTRLLVKPTEETKAKFGITQASDRIFDTAYQGIDLSIRSGDSVFFIGELGWSPQLAKLTKQLCPFKIENTSEPEDPDTEVKQYPGNYWFGAYFTPWQNPQFGTSNLARNGYGFYWHADQMVFQETSASDQGLIIWSSFVFSPQQNISLLPFQANGGFVYQGLVPFRDNDYTVFAAYYGSISRNFAREQNTQGLGYPTYELVFEWGYRIQITKFAYVQPDIQWVINPGGTGQIPNALVLGAQIGVNF